MKTHVLTGTKLEIALRLAQINGEVREAIVFEEEAPRAPSNGHPDVREDIFAEMAAYMVETPAIDDSRDAIYSRIPGE